MTPEEFDAFLATGPTLEETLAVIRDNIGAIITDAVEVLDMTDVLGENPTEIEGIIIALDQADQALGEEP